MRILRVKEEFFKKLRKLDPDDLYRYRDLIESLPEETLSQIGKHKFTIIRKNFYEKFGLFELKNYPKICRYFGFQEFIDQEIFD
jgi:hypothetical protein